MASREEMNSFFIRIYFFVVYNIHYCKYTFSNFPLLILSCPNLVLLEHFGRYLFKNPSDVLGIERSG